MSAAFRFVVFSVLPFLQDGLIVLFAVRGFLTRQRRRREARAPLVSLSPVLFWVGSLVGGLLSVPLSLFQPSEMPVGVWWIFELFVLVCLAMLLAYCHETVVYDARHFEASNLLGVKRSYSYDEITGLARRAGDVLLYCGRRKLRLDAMAEGRDEFIVYADRACFRRNKRGIPLLRRKHDPLNGNLDAPWLYLAIWMFAFAAGVLMLVLPLWAVLSPNDSLPDDAAEIRITFSSYEQINEEGGKLLLYAPGQEKPFSLSWLSGYEISLPAPEALCSGDPFLVTAREGSQEFFICSLSDGNGQPIIRVHDRNVAYRKAELSYAIALALFGLLCLSGAVLGVLIGRQPERYPRWLRRAFYKDSAWVASLEDSPPLHAKRRKRP